MHATSETGALSGRDMRTILGVMMVTLLAGCTIQYTPKPNQNDLVVVPVFKPGAPVAIINKTPSLEVLVPVSRRDLQVDYGKYAEAAVQLMQGELQRRGALVQDMSSREIRLTLTNMRIVSRFSQFRCVMDTTVVTGDGFVRGFEVSSVSGSYETAIDGAIVETVKAILSHDRVRRYLSE